MSHSLTGALLADYPSIDGIRVCLSIPVHIGTYLTISVGNVKGKLLYF